MASSDSAASRRRAFVGRSRLWRDLGEIGLVALAFLLYFVVRANVVDRPEAALANARALVDVERGLGIYVEASWQAWVLDADLAVRFFNFVYFWLDFPLIAALGLFLYFNRRRQYTLTRDAILISGGLALIFYFALPVAPPRLLPEAGVIDTLQAFNNLSYQAQSTQFFVNPYAALPSLHVGWAFLIALGAAWAFPGNRLVLGLAGLHVTAQAASTVLTGNHYFLDGAAGIGVAALGLFGALFMQRRGYAYLGRALGMAEGQSESAGRR